MFPPRTTPSVFSYTLPQAHPKPLTPFQCNNPASTAKFLLQYIYAPIYVETNLTLSVTQTLIARAFNDLCKIQPPRTIPWMRWRAEKLVEHTDNGSRPHTAREPICHLVDIHTHAKPTGIPKYLLKIMRQFKQQFQVCTADKSFGKVILQKSTFSHLIRDYFIKNDIATVTPDEALCTLNRVTSLNHISQIKPKEPSEPTVRLHHPLCRLQLIMLHPSEHCRLLAGFRPLVKIHKTPITIRPVISAHNVVISQIRCPAPIRALFKKAFPSKSMPAIMKPLKEGFPTLTSDRLFFVCSDIKNCFPTFTPNLANKAGLAFLSKHNSVFLITQWNIFIDALFSLNMFIHLDTVDILNQPAYSIYKLPGAPTGHPDIPMLQTIITDYLDQLIYERISMTTYFMVRVADDGLIITSAPARYMQVANRIYNSFNLTLSLEVSEHSAVFCQLHISVHTYNNRYNYHWYPLIRRHQYLTTAAPLPFVTITGVYKGIYDRITSQSHPIFSASSACTLYIAPAMLQWLSTQTGANTASVPDDKADDPAVSRIFISRCHRDLLKSIRAFLNWCPQTPPVQLILAN